MTNMTATMNLNTVKNGIEITFNEKPSDVVRTALKDAGFRWGGKLGYWFAKNTESRMALANEICKPQTKSDKKSKAKAQTKSDKKADKKKPQTKSENKAKKPSEKAEPKKAETVEIPMVEHTFKLGDLSDKIAFTIVHNDGTFKTVKGYMCTATLDNKKIKIGVYKASKDSWNVTDLETGIRICSGEKRYLALNAVTAERMAYITEAKKTKEIKEIAANLKKYNKAHA